MHSLHMACAYCIYVLLYKTYEVAGNRRWATDSSRAERDLRQSGELELTLKSFVRLPERAIGPVE